MKKLIYVFVILMLSIASCKPDPNYHYGNRKAKPVEKYPAGAVVYLKPDSTKAVIIEKSCDCTTVMYKINYTDKNGVYQEAQVVETSIY
jgi:hypothetical protein